MDERTNNNLRVLVVDGYPDAADTLALLLTLWGYECRVARTGREAIHIAGVFKPAVALVDPHVHDLDGYEACRRLRELGAEVVVLSGLADERHLRRCAEAGLIHVTLKPAEPAELKARLVTLAAA